MIYNFLVTLKLIFYMLPNWVPTKLLKQIADSLNDPELKLVGGAVRAVLLGETAWDFDLVTQVDPLKAGIA
jgi:tRNA nucleotidyltransferase/poly(A) polymerase